jgi:hypothetical protein
MRTPSAVDLLSVWERGRNLPPVHQAIELLSVACLAESDEDLFRLTIGQRDAALLSLREATFGPNMCGVIECPSCGTSLELSFSVSDVLLAKSREPVSKIFWEGADYAVCLRPPNSADVVATFQASPEQRANILFHRCLISASHRGEPAAELPAEFIDEASNRICEADPQADVQLHVACSFCGHKRCVLFDIASFFWNEIETWAARLLGEVHALASAYGWSEREILSLSPLRRQFYLEAVRS